MERFTVANGVENVFDTTTLLPGWFTSADFSGS